MPTVSVDKAELWERLGKEYSNLISRLFLTSFTNDHLAATEEFDKLCFDYGLELDEDVCPIIDTLNKSDQQFLLQTTAEVEEAIKKGLPAERPVSQTSPPSLLSN